LGYTLLATYILNVASSLQSADGEEAMIAEFEIILSAGKSSNQLGVSTGWFNS